MSNLSNNKVEAKILAVSGGRISNGIASIIAYIGWKTDEGARFDRVTILLGEGEKVKIGDKINLLSVNAQ